MATERQGKHALLLDDLLAARWVQTYDAAWLSQDWFSLAGRLAPEVVFVNPTASEPLVGRAAVLENLRELLSGVRMHEYNATDLKGYDCGDTGVISYRWQLDCTTGQERRQSTGRDVLVLRKSVDNWLLAWRGQFRS